MTVENKPENKYWRVTFLQGQPPEARTLYAESHPVMTDEEVLAGIQLHVAGSYGAGPVQAVEPAKPPTLGGPYQVTFTVPVRGSFG